MAVEPVKEMSGKRLSSTILLARSLSLEINKENILSQPHCCMTSLQICCTANATNGALEEGFQIMVFPQIAAKNAFHAHTATGKLNAVITPIGPKGCHCSII